MTSLKDLKAFFKEVLKKALGKLLKEAWFEFYCEISLILLEFSLSFYFLTLTGSQELDRKVTQRR